MSDENGYFYLNQVNEWPQFAAGIEKADGSLMLTKPEEQQFFARGLFLARCELPLDAVQWSQLRVFADPLPSGTHIQLYTRTSDNAIVGFDPSVDRPFRMEEGWQAAPCDALDMLILNPPGHYLFIGGVLLSDGHATPILHQIRVDYGRTRALQLLPAIYDKNDAGRDFLARLLALFESVHGGLDTMIDHGLPQLFDPLAAPSEGYTSWLAWLAEWLAFDLNEGWSEEERRAYLASAFSLHCQRGTVAGLQRAIKQYAGVDAHIEEPGRHTHLWVLGESALDATTMLPSGHVQGAVLDTTAVLDQSHLTQGDELGSLLFEDLAHHFRVLIPESTNDSKRNAVRQVIEREKAAHTTYDLCTIDK